MGNNMDNSYFEMIFVTGVKEELIKTGITKEFLEKFLEYVHIDIEDNIKYFNDNHSFLDEVKIEKTKTHIKKYNMYYEQVKSFIIKKLSSLNELENNYLIELCDFIARFKNYISDMKNYITTLKNRFNKD